MIRALANAAFCALEIACIGVYVAGVIIGAIVFGGVP